MDDRFKIVEAATGAGGYGRIDKAIDTILERPVAIKTLDPVFTAELSPEDIERFRREAKSVARLSHPNIPAIYDVEFSPERSEFKIVFEWIDGQTLRHHLQERGVLTLEEAREAFSSICSALAHAHAHHIIHRDIKPTNVILTPKASTCYLVDFGISLRRDDLARITNGSPIGTPGYMSPEQERGEHLGPASDIFSLGVLLYECLAGLRPTVGGYQSLTLHNESIPPAVDDLVQEALRDDAQGRPQTATEFSDRLTEALRPHSNFTTTLAGGSLHEIQLALNKMDSDDYAALPAGQRVLMVTRLNDLANVDEPRVRSAVAALLAELVRLAHESRPEHYAQIVKYTLEYGYEKQFGETYYGNGPARQALSAVSLVCGRSAHDLITREVLQRSGEDTLTGRFGWYYHDFRLLLQNLLTNPACRDDEAEPLGEALATVNTLSHQPAS